MTMFFVQAASSEPEKPDFVAGFRQLVYKHLNLSMPTDPALPPRVGIIGRFVKLGLM